jgi:hypothetical protein
MKQRLANAKRRNEIDASGGPLGLCHQLCEFGTETVRPKTDENLGQTREASGIHQSIVSHFGRFLSCLPCIACCCFVAFCFLLLSLSFLPPLSPIA